jgi:hypothetical protein
MLNNVCFTPLKYLCYITRSRSLCLHIFINLACRSALSRRRRASNKVAWTCIVSVRYDCYTCWCAGMVATVFTKWRARFVLWACMSYRGNYEAVLIFWKKSVCYSQCAFPFKGSHAKSNKWTLCSGITAHFAHALTTCHVVPLTRDSAHLAFQRPEDQDKATISPSSAEIVITTEAWL